MHVLATERKPRFERAPRAEITLTPRDVDAIRTSVYRKLVAYFETWRQGLQTTHFGFKNFRVLTVTNGRERVTHQVEANRMVHPEGSRLFLFADLAELTAGDALRFAWTNGKGEKTTLLD